jgi:hypothetical protein
MEAANILYGVTMEQPGVSRIVSVHLKHEGEAANEPALIVRDPEELAQEAPDTIATTSSTVTEG